MGYGDDLLVTALAANLKKKFPNRQIVIGNFANVHYCEIVPI